MKKFLTLFALAGMLCALLCGCMCETAEAEINADGSGVVRVQFGFSEAVVERMELSAQMAEQSFSPFTYDGTVYYGDSAEESFADPAGFNAIFNTAGEEMAEISTEIDMGGVTLRENADGSLTLTVRCDEKTGSAEHLGGELSEKADDLNTAEIEQLLADMVMRYTFTFQHDVRQLSGGAAGVTVEGNVVTLDLLKLQESNYQFTTSDSAYVIPDITPTQIPDSGVVRMRKQNVEIDGTPVSFQTYAVVDGGGEINYVKLRDVAYALSGTAAQFGVDWDGDVILLPAEAYEPNGSEMKTPFTGDRSYKRAQDETKIYGQSVPLSAITLTDGDGGDYTYYKLRDLAQALGFNVGWDAQRGIYIESDQPYAGD